MEDYMQKKEIVRSLINTMISNFEEIRKDFESKGTLYIFEAAMGHFLAKIASENMKSFEEIVYCCQYSMSNATPIMQNGKLLMQTKRDLQ